MPETRVINRKRRPTAPLLGRNLWLPWRFPSIYLLGNMCTFVASFPPCPPDNYGRSQIIDFFPPQSVFASVTSDTLFKEIEFYARNIVKEFQCLIFHCNMIVSLCKLHCEKTFTPFLRSIINLGACSSQRCLFRWAPKKSSKIIL